MGSEFFHFNSIKENRSWLAVALVALSMPFYHSWSALAIVVLFIVLISDSNVWKRLGSFKQNRLLFPMLLLYVMFCIGFLYTANKEEGWSDLQTLFPLLLFPVFLAPLDYSKPEKTDFVILSFMTGCLLAALISLGAVAYDWFATGVNNFFYTKLSLFMHPSYFALYLNFIVCYIYQKLIFGDPVKPFRRSFFVFILFFINVFILLLSSKAGIITAAIVQAAMLTDAIITRRKSRSALILFLGMTLFCSFFYKVLIPGDRERIMNSEQAIVGKPLLKTSTESSGIRLLIWRSSLPLIKKEFLLGAGTGDVKAELMKVYESNGITAAFSNELNAHNQFLQTMLAIGLPGFILLVLSLALPFIKGIREKNYLLYMFSFIVAFNFLFESMLERQVGVVFFALFSTLLLMTNARKVDWVT